MAPVLPTGAQRIGSPEDLHTADVSDDTVVVLPLGATEQHGSHLPLETDSMIAASRT